MGGKAAALLDGWQSLRFSSAQPVRTHSVAPPNLTFPIDVGWKHALFWFIA
jgi:hypothetical protein